MVHLNFMVTERLWAGRKTQVHRKAGIYPAIFFCGESYMQEKILSIFIDESGDFGKYDSKNPYYYVSLVLHNQAVNITENIKTLEEHLRNIGYSNHAIHTGPIIRREQFYKNELMENRKTLFNSLYHFTRKLDINYLIVKIDKKECEDNVFAYTAKLAKQLSNELKLYFDFFNSFDLIINYYDNGQGELTKIITTVFSTLFDKVEFRKVKPSDYKLFQVADLICTLELTKDKADKNAMSKSELEFFHSAKDFKKNIYKHIEKKKIKYKK